MSASTTSHNVNDSAQAASTRTRNTAENVKSNPTVQAVAGHPVVQSTINSFNNQLSMLDKELEKNSFAREFEAKTKVSKTTAFLITAATYVSHPFWLPSASFLAFLRNLTNRLFLSFHPIHDVFAPRLTVSSSVSGSTCSRSLQP